MVALDPPGAVAAATSREAESKLPLTAALKVGGPTVARSLGLDAASTASAAARSTPPGDGGGSRRRHPVASPSPRAVNGDTERTALGSAGPLALGIGDNTRRLGLMDLTTTGAAGTAPPPTTPRVVATVAPSHGKCGGAVLSRTKAEVVDTAATGKAGLVPSRDIKDPLVFVGREYRLCARSGWRARSALGSVLGVTRALPFSRDRSGGCSACRSRSR